jgi:hypothetical protein
MRCGGGGSICSIQSDEAISAQCDETTNTGEQRSICQPEVFCAL